MIMTNRMNCFSPQILLCVLLLTFAFLPSAFASEGTVLPEKQVSYVHYETNLVLEKVIENTVIISGEKYIYTNKTHLAYRDQRTQGVRFSKISSPCLVDLVYRQYAITTEAEPFAPGTRILEKLTIIEKIDPATLGSNKNEDSLKVN